MARSHTEARIDTPAAFQARFGISNAVREKLETYETLLKKWQKTINLVALSTLDDIWDRHFADSAQLWPLRPPEAKTWLDLGSGAGFPGLVLAILASETGQTHHTLVESDSRKAAFLREVARQTGVAVDILCMRIENPETHAKVGVADCVTARALAPLSKLVEIAAPYFGPSTLGFFLKGRDATAEVEKAAQDWQFAFELIPSVTEEDGRVVLLKALKPRVSKPKTEG
ncbi:16S rRNA (guanine(527)-N(7))-methyltransferase RsmG [Hyphomicrobium sp. MC1]|uniref:16S rRNA (guanine(527)-N(7))-methyltransferase RsmG n=1 Tax=Hyphomicrobium sp. (strain MC1) TaxID=717785 RepID=UPI000213E6FE|nr:16S rRNA (guanine(527)-N(7))-methyltransferase RsmG [Hyphomicrobium sp. MC1]CCB67757.1 Methyltransferase gidB (Glucose-inhibited division protein B) [Hyphomicrobium sp. MC1]